ncbi:hypothetical protein Tco_1323255, partial [Tanacetum coccineum]
VYFVAAVTAVYCKVEKEKADEEHEYFDIYAVGVRGQTSIFHNVKFTGSNSTNTRRTFTAMLLPLHGQLISDTRDEEECSHLLPWLSQKAGTEISSHLTIGKSVYGRSLFASKPIQAGDYILKIPKSAHLTADNLHPSVSSFLGEGISDRVKLALVVLLHQKLGQVTHPLAPPTD